MTTPISGHVAPGWEGVADAFAANFAERGELGSAVSVVHHGRSVVDLWGGWADGARRRRWQPDTMVNLYSVGKAIVATLALRLVDAGRLDLDAPVADIWPEFAAGGKAEITVAEALSHRARVPGIRTPLRDADLADWSTMTEALAATPAWGPGHCYHTNTYGHLVGEITRRVTGELPGTQLAGLLDDLGRPAAGDLWIGVPADEQRRCAEVVWDSPTALPAVDLDEVLAPDAPLELALPVLSYTNPPGYSSIGIVNTPLWRSAQLPSTNAHGTARALAAFYRALLEPDRVLRPATLARATTVHSSGPCPILNDDAAFGLGFVPTTARRPLGDGPRSFGHFGTGGAVGFADPDAELAFGYAMNHVVPRWQSSRNRALIDAAADAARTVDDAAGPASGGSR